MLRDPKVIRDRRKNRCRETMWLPCAHPCRFRFSFLRPTCQTPAGKGPPFDRGSLPQLSPGGLARRNVLVDWVVPDPSKCRPGPIEMRNPSAKEQRGPDDSEHDRKDDRSRGHGGDSLLPESDLPPACSAGVREGRSRPIAAAVGASERMELLKHEVSDLDRDRSTCFDRLGGC